MRYRVVNSPVLQDMNKLTCDDIAPKVKKKKSGAYYAFSLLRIVVFIICFFVFVFSVKNIAENFSSYNESNNFYDNIKDNFDSMFSSLNNNLVSAPKPIPLKGFDAMLDGKGEVAPPESNEKMQQLITWQNTLLNMKREIPDIYGWIKIPGTNIDYPVVQGTDNQFYVNYSADKTMNVAGAIFVDFRQKKPPESTQNLVLYGHNIRTWGTMFNGLVNYLYEDFFITHPTVSFSTLTGIYEYTVISVCETDIYSNYADIYFANSKEFEDFQKDVMARSLYVREGVTLDKDSKLITLSTCSNSFNGDNRYVVVAVLTSQITANQ